MTVISPIVYRPMRALFSPRSRSSLPLAAALALLATSALAQQTEPQQTDPVPPPPAVGDNAQNPPPEAKATAVPQVDLLAALQSALRTHPSVQSARQKLTASNYELDAAEYRLYPTPAIDLGAISGSSRSNGNQTSISVTQPLYAFGRYTSAIDAAESRVSAATVAIDEAQLDLMDQTVTAYYEVVKAEARLAVQNRFVDQHRDLRDTVERRLKAEVGSESDLVLAQTRLSQAQNDRSLIEAQVKKARNTLMNLTSLNAAQVVPPALLDAPFRSEEAFQSKALAYSPNLKRLRAESIALKQDAAVAWANTKPQLVLRAERVESNVPTPYADNRLITALQYQPGAGFSAGSVAQAAEAKAVAAELDIRSAQLKLTERVSTVYSDLTANLTQARNLERVLRLNNDFFQSMLRQFQLGKRSWLDVLNALRDSNQSELGYATAAADAQLNSRRALLLSGQLEAVVDAGKGAAQ